MSGWFGGPYEFKGLKVSVQSVADVHECEEGFDWYQKLDDEWRAEDVDMDYLEAEEEVEWIKINFSLTDIQDPLKVQLMMMIIDSVRILGARVSDPKEFRKSEIRTS